MPPGASAPSPISPPTTVRWPSLRRGFEAALPYILRCASPPASGAPAHEYGPSKPPGPSMLHMTAGRSRRVDPRSIPRTARRCCSNCDVSDETSVWWPELCTRGAISLTSTAPDRSTNISMPNTPAPSSTSMVRRATRAASSRTPLGARAGATVVRSIPSSCMFSTAGYVAMRPRVLRAAITDTSIPKSTARSTMTGRPPKCASAPPASPCDSMRRLPLPSYPSRRALSTAGQPSRPSAASSSAGPSTPAKSATAMPLSRRSDFCSSLSCTTRSVAGEGLTCDSPWMDSSTSASPDSISYVMMSARDASSRMASLSRNPATIWPAPACAAGQPGVGSRTIVRDMRPASPSDDEAASASILPSCPPPMIPITAPTAAPRAEAKNILRGAAGAEGGGTARAPRAGRRVRF